jgi:transcriptional regulator with XRE-family HTH domain
MKKKESHQKNIGQRLRTAREIAGLSQAQVAKMLSLHRPSVSEMEAGRRKVSAEELVKMAEIYDVDISWLSGAKHEETGNESDKLKLAARELSKLKPKDYERVLKLMNILRTERREH